MPGKLPFFRLGLAGCHAGSVHFHDYELLPKTVRYTCPWGIFLPHETLPLFLGQFKGEHSLDIPIILSVLVLSVLPMIILFIIFQDKLVKGMMAGAVKG